MNILLSAAQIQRLPISIVSTYRYSPWYNTRLERQPALDLMRGFGFDNFCCAEMEFIAFSTVYCFFANVCFPNPTREKDLLASQGSPSQVRQEETTVRIISQLLADVATAPPPRPIKTHSFTTNKLDKWITPPLPPSPQGRWRSSITNYERRKKGGE